VFRSLVLVISASVWFISDAVSASGIGVAAALNGSIKRIAVVSNASTIGPIQAGDSVFIGDHIVVESDSEVQILLNDETAFTLKSGAELVLDEFLNQDNGRLRATVPRGAFRFVSGKIATQGQDVMQVELPNAVIGVRGTQVAGLARPDGSSQVILLGPGPNSFGETPGRISISNDLGQVDVRRPGFSVNIPTNEAPEAPIEATEAVYEEVASIETTEAAEEIADALGISAASLEAGITDDGQYIGNEEIGAAFAARIEGTDATNDRALLATLAYLQGGEDALYRVDKIGDEGLGAVSFGYGIDYLFTDGFTPLGRTTVAEALDSSLSGSATFVATNIPLVGDCSTQCGSYNATTVWNFDNDTVSMVLDGNVSSIQVTPGDDTTTFSLDFALGSNTNPEVLSFTDIQSEYSELEPAISALFSLNTLDEIDGSNSPRVSSIGVDNTQPGNTTLHISNINVTGPLSGTQTGYVSFETTLDNIQNADGDTVIGGLGYQNVGVTLSGGGEANGRVYSTPQ